MYKKIILATSVLSLMCACTTDPYTGERKISNSAKYATGGAIAGALVGQLTGAKNTKSTLIGAAVGAAAGGGLGYYLDNQESKLRADLQGTGVSVQRTENSIKLIMPGNVTFNSNSSDINSSFYRVLNSVATVFKKYNKTTIGITGHTDSTGSNALNQTLSYSRAQSVGNYLISQGIVSNRVSVQGYGSSSPIASNSTASGKAMNRRVEINIVPTEQ